MTGVQTCALPISISRNDGTLKWKYHTDDSVQSAPTIDGDTLYVGSDDDNVYAININDGSLKWKFTTGDDIKSSPAIWDSKVYVGSDDSQVYALDAQNGAEVWEYNAGSSVSSSPSLDQRQSTLYVGTEDGDLLALDMRDGLKKWNKTIASEVNSTPSIFGNNIAVSTTSGSVEIFNKFTGEGTWSFNPGYLPNVSGSMMSPVTSGGSLFVAADDGNVYSIDTDEKAAPLSPYTAYYVVAIVVIIAAAAVIRKVMKGKKQ